MNINLSEGLSEGAGDSDRIDSSFLLDELSLGFSPVSWSSVLLDFFSGRRDSLAEDKESADLVPSRYPIFPSGEGCLNYEADFS